MTQPRGVHRIVDRPEDHEAPGAWDWDRGSRRRLDDAAASAARRFLVAEAEAESCWRCEVAPAEGAIGLCTPCLDELRGPEHPR